MPEPYDPAEKYREKAGILAEFGRIVCISAAFFHTDESGATTLRLHSFSGDDEVEILRNFADLCERIDQLRPQFQFAGHNIREFDIPYICRRLLINRLPLPACLQLHDRKPWEVKMFDTLNWWKFGDHKNYISLHLLASVLGIPTSKTDMDGSRVQEVYYREKNVPRIVDYCQKDVVVTANIVLRFLSMPMLTAEQVVVI
ncbi:ribonuclease H-like domain-containing protein [Sediminibacterium soli]|uniref:ribonuclease H-like domain-containing protein n=1 Tax=Sediminibacterium soli TaxID=2698829 RepID=UPI00293BBAAF|nr:ribonuclease H-like domain-containing protein [Sediminibacterium soli]